MKEGKFFEAATLLLSLIGGAVIAVLAFCGVFRI